MRLLHQCCAGTVRVGLDVVHGGRQDNLRPLAKGHARQARQRAAGGIEVRGALQVLVEAVPILCRLIERVGAGQVDVTLRLYRFLASSSVGNLRPYGLGRLVVVALVGDVCH